VIFELKVFYNDILGIKNIVFSDISLPYLQF
jgi:hypothetical protein